MRLDEKWIREHLPKDCADENIDVFSGYYLDGLTVMSQGERGGSDKVIYVAKDEQDLRYWQFENICHFVGKTNASKVWRYYRHHAENDKWFYTERKHYDYNAIEDSRLPGFENYLRNLKCGFPPERWEQKVREYVRLMNYWYIKPHWDYDREQLRFIEISSSKEHDGDGIEEPRPNSVIRIIE